MKITSFALIPKPRQAVSNVLMDTRSWKAWYGEGLLGVEPALAADAEGDTSAALAAGRCVGSDL